MTASCLEASPLSASCSRAPAAPAVTLACCKSGPQSCGNQVGIGQCCPGGLNPTISRTTPVRMIWLRPPSQALDMHDPSAAAGQELHMPRHLCIALSNPHQRLDHNCNSRCMWAIGQKVSGRTLCPRRNISNSLHRHTMNIYNGTSPHLTAGSWKKAHQGLIVLRGECQRPAGDGLCQPRRSAQRAQHTAQVFQRPEPLALYELRCGVV